MKPSYIKLGALLCLATLNLCCVAQTSPLNGSWKVDPATKKFDGTNFSMATDANGFTWTQPGRDATKNVCDGQPKPTPDGSASTCRKTESGYVIETAKPESKTTISLSRDANTLTYRAEGVMQDGSHFAAVETLKRVAGGPGVEGVWHPIGFDVTPDSGIVKIEITGDTARLKESDADKPTTYKLNRTEVKLPNGANGSAQLVDPHTLKVTYSTNGTAYRENTFVVSEDGKTLTETDITPAPNRSTFSAVYHKL